VTADRPLNYFEAPAREINYSIFEGRVPTISLMGCTQKMVLLANSFRCTDPDMFTEEFRSRAKMLKVVKGRIEE